MTIAGRIFFRVPVKIHAVILLPQQSSRIVLIRDLSTSGIGFSIDSQEELPLNFEAEFGLFRLSKPIRVSLEVKNKAVFGKTQRLGCRFTKISDGDRQLINDYLCNYLDMSFPRRMISLAAFFLAFDALMRLMLFVVNAYYVQTGFGLSGQARSSYESEGMSLLVYLFCALTSVLLVGDRRRKKGFLISLLTLAAALVFISTKAVTYARLEIDPATGGGISLYCLLNLLFAVYALFALVFGLFSYARISRVSDIVEQHLKKSQPRSS